MDYGGWFVGSYVGAVCCGRLSDIFGRRKIILVSAVIFAVGALWSGLATDLKSLVFSRLFLGIAIGVASFTVPLYIAEIAPAKSRGRLVSMFQLMVTIGILLSYMSDTFWLMKTSWIVGDGCFGQVSYRLWYYW